MLDRPPPVPPSHFLEGGTVGQVSLKALAAKVLRCPTAVDQPGQLQDPCTETVPLSRTSGRGTAGQALEWDADDWHGFFEERAAIAEHDGGLSRAEAEARAWKWTVAEWLNQHMPRSESDRCAWCGTSNRNGAGVVVPFGTEAAGHVWLHPECHGPFMARRRAEAVAALAEMGVTPRAGTLGA